MAKQLKGAAPRMHFLKTWVEPFRAIVDGKKRFDLRRNDRDYQVGDILILVPYDPDTNKFLKGYIAVEVTYTLTGEQWGIKEGYCAMSFAGLTNVTQEVKDYYIFMLTAQANITKN